MVVAVEHVICQPASVNSAQRRAAVLLLVGGVLEAAYLIVFTLISVVLPVPVSLLLYAVPLICIGAGLIALGVSVRERGRVTLIVAGGFYLAGVVALGVQLATLTSLGRGVSFLAILVQFGSILVAAAVLLSDRSLRGPVRWIIAVPAACVLLTLVSVFVPLLGWARFDVLTELGFAFAGVMLLRHARSITQCELDPGNARGSGSRP